MSNLLTISYGDTPDGPLMLEAVLLVMVEAGAVLEIETVQLGHEMERLEFAKGYDDEGLSKIRRAGILLKAPTLKDITPNLREDLGEDYLIFEAVTPDMSAMLRAAMEMLQHAEQHEAAERIQTAMAKVPALEDAEKFAEAIIREL